MTKFLLKRDSIGELTGSGKKATLAKYLTGTIRVCETAEAAMEAAKEIMDDEPPIASARGLIDGIYDHLLAHGLRITEAREEKLSRVYAFATLAEAEAAHPVYLRADGWGWSEASAATPRGEGR